MSTETIADLLRDVAPAPTPFPPIPPIPDDKISRWREGCALYIVGSVLINFGQVLIRLSHVTRGRSDPITLDTLTEIPESRRRGNSWSYIYWILGTLFFAGGALFNVVGLNLAAQSLLEALGFSVIILGESLQRRHLLSTTLIVLGNILIVAWGDHENQKITRSHLLDLVGRTQFIVYMACVYTGAAVLGLLECWVSRSRRGDGGRLSVVLFALSSASVGANCAMVLKALSGLLHTYLVDSPSGGPPPKPKVVACITVVALVGAAHIVFWLTRLNQGLKRYPALFIVPLLQASWIVFTVTSGGIFFKEFDDMSPHQVAGFASGLAVVVVGIGLLMPCTADKFGGGQTPSPEGEEELDQEGIEGVSQARQLMEGGWLTQSEFKRVRKQLHREALARTRGRDASASASSREQVPSSWLPREQSLLGDRGGCFESVDRWLDEPVQLWCCGGCCGGAANDLEEPLIDGDEAADAEEGCCGVS